MRERPGRDDEKLFATIPTQLVTLADYFRQAARNFFQSGITGDMTEGIVDRFEIVDVRHDDADRNFRVCAAPTRARSAARMMAPWFSAPVRASRLAISESFLPSSISCRFLSMICR